MSDAGGLPRDEVAGLPRDAVAGLPREWTGSWLRTLARRRPVRLLLALVALAAAAAATVALLSPLSGAVLVVAVVVLLDELLFPVRYRLEDEALVIRTPLRTRRYAWPEFTEVRATEVGVLLRSPVRRSAHLLCDRPVRDPLLAACRARVDDARSSHGSPSAA